MTEPFAAPPSLSVDAMPCAALYADAGGRILSANDRFEELWITHGGDRRLLHSGTVVAALFEEEGRHPLEETIAGHPSTSGPLSWTMRLAPSCASMLVELAPVARDGAAGAAWLIMIHEAEGTAASNSTGGFAEVLTAGAVHDLRTPLQVVLGWVALLKRTHVEEPRLEHALSVIGRNAQLELELLDDMLEMVRPDGSHAHRQRDLVDLTSLLRTTSDGLQPEADDRGVRLLNVTQDAPPLIVWGNRVQLHRVVANLLSNALKFTPRGGTVECAASCAGSSAQLMVRDDGAGIAPQFLEQIFEPFWQEPSHESAAVRGLGLGLSVVRHLVERHGGRVTAESAGPGRGTTFTVLLPLAAVHHPQHDLAIRSWSEGAR
ncbi:MAG: sensor histidine kinase [Vicinamibacterales bacterium]